MKRSLYALMLLATFGFTACGGDDKDEQEQSGCTETQVTVEVDGVDKCFEPCPAKASVCVTDTASKKSQTTVYQCETATADSEIQIVKDKKVTDCDNGCNADNTACAPKSSEGEGGGEQQTQKTPEEEKNELCHDGGEDICDEGYECRIVMMGEEKSPICVKPGSTCEKVSEEAKSCQKSSSGKDAIATLTCYAGAGADEGKNYGFELAAECKDTEMCGDKDGELACIPKKEEEKPSGKKCGDAFVATCNADGSTTACIKGEIKTTPRGESVGTCHVFAEAQMAQYVLEVTCTVVELPQNICIDGGGVGIYSQKTCAQAEDGKWYWYMSDADFCVNGCKDEHFCNE